MRSFRMSLDVCKESASQSALQHSRVIIAPCEACNLPTAFMAVMDVLIVNPLSPEASSSQLTIALSSVECVTLWPHPYTQPICLTLAHTGLVVRTTPTSNPERNNTSNQLELCGRYHPTLIRPCGMVIRPPPTPSQPASDLTLDTRLLQLQRGCLAIRLVQRCLLISWHYDPDKACCMTLPTAAASLLLSRCAVRIAFTFARLPGSGALTRGPRPTQHGCGLMGQTYTWTCAGGGWTDESKSYMEARLHRWGELCKLVLSGPMLGDCFIQSVHKER
jgi:hypothetical protein